MSQKSERNFFSFKDSTELLAIINSDQKITYQKLFDTSNKISHSLSRFGIIKNEYVPILIDNNLNFIETTIALWNLQAVPVPLNTKLLDEEIKSILDDHDFKFLITDKKSSINFQKEKTKLINFNEIELLKEYKDFKIPNIENESVVILTSGSTGKPKGVIHTFKTLINNIENGEAILNTDNSSRLLASLPFYHIGGFQIICRSLYYGCTIILPKSIKFNHLVEAITEFNPTHISLVSSQLNKLIKHKIEPPKSLKLSLIGGGFIDDDLLDKANELGWKTFRSFGTSETGSFITAISPKEVKSKPQSVGKTFKDNQIKITNDSEILIRSNSLFKSYLDDKKETFSKLKDGYFHSGDLGFLDDDGYLFLEARRNDLIVTGGENVNPVEVEKAILQIEGISDVCVFGKSDKTWGQVIACVLVLEDAELNEVIVKERLKQSIVGYKIPKKYFFSDKLPRTTLGKLEREKIRKLY